MTTLEAYIQQFSSLRRAPGPGWRDTTRKRAPHKPILLLAVLDLVARGVITTPVIDVTGDLVELNELFNGYWRRIVPLGQSSSIAFPFSRLHNEPFWKLVPIPGNEVTPALINNISNVGQLRLVATGARMDDDLFHGLGHSQSRNALREAILLACFSEQARITLMEQSTINAEAYSYGQELVRVAHLSKVEEPTKAYRPAARYQGFRRIVVNTYEHRCALCGVRIISQEGHTVVDAAHIVPWSKTQNDDIKNGMALCKLCHWSFDEGMMGISNRYEVIVSRNLTVNPNFPGFLMTLAGRGVILPGDRDLWPAQEYLAEHRQDWRL